MLPSRLGGLYLCIMGACLCTTSICKSQREGFLLPRVGGCLCLLYSCYILVIWRMQALFQNRSIEKASSPPEKGGLFSVQLLCTNHIEKVFSFQSLGACRFPCRFYIQGIWRREAPFQSLFCAVSLYRAYTRKTDFAPSWGPASLYSGGMFFFLYSFYLQVTRRRPPLPQSWGLSLFVVQLLDTSHMEKAGPHSNPFVVQLLNTKPITEKNIHSSRLGGPVSLYNGGLSVYLCNF